MLNQTELTDYCNRHKLSPVARQIINQVRTSPPTRRVKSGVANVACRFASRKMGCIIQAESHRNELPAIIGWEYDANTFEYYDQPSRIKLTYLDGNGRRRGHLTTPDFFVLLRDFAGWVECKTEQWLKAEAAKGSRLFIPDGSGGWRCPAGEAYATALGLGFRVRSSAETNWTAVRNAEFLSDYLDERTPAPTPDQLAQVRDILAAHAWIHLKDLLESSEAVPADAIFTMVAQGQLHIELGRDLLAEPERTLVFRDAVSAQAYRVHLESTTQPAIPGHEAITIVAGQSLLWDGRPWRILNAGESEVFLGDDERTVTTLPRDVFGRLVRDGAIRGLPGGTAVPASDADHLVRTSSPEGFTQALKRYYSIFPERGDGSAPAGKERVRRYWRAMYRKSSEQRGIGFLGLLPKTHRRGNRQRKLGSDVVAIMNRVIDDHFAKPGERTLVSCWGEVINQCREVGQPAPSEKTFRAEVRRRRQHDLAVAREGEKAAYELEEFQWFLERTSPRHGERPFEIGVDDDWRHPLLEPAAAGKPVAAQRRRRHRAAATMVSGVHGGDDRDGARCHASVGLVARTL